MKKIVQFICVGILAYSCTPPMYIPNTTNTPSLKEEGDFEGSLSTGTGGYNIQSAYAITNDYGVMLNGSIGNEKGDSSINFLKFNFIEVGGGRTFILNKDSDRETKTIFSAFTGVGTGSTSGLVNFSNMFNTDISYINTAKGNFIRAFIQPSIGVSGNNVDFFFTLRTSYVNVYKLETNMEADWQNSYVSDDDYNEYLELLKRKTYNIFVEPTLTLKVGGKSIKGFLQVGASLGTIPNIETTFRQRPIITVIGIQTDLNFLKK